MIIYSCYKKPWLGSYTYSYYQYLSDMKFYYMYLLVFSLLQLQFANAGKYLYVTINNSLCSYIVYVLVS